MNRLAACGLALFALLVLVSLGDVSKDVRASVIPTEDVTMLLAGESPAADAPHCHKRSQTQSQTMALDLIAMEAARCLSEQNRRSAARPADTLASGLAPAPDPNPPKHLRTA